MAHSVHVSNEFPLPPLSYRWPCHAMLSHPKRNDVYDGSFINVAVLYGFSLAYLVAPGTFDSAHVIEFVAGLPDYVKTSARVLLAAPFALHGWNGIRHLLWDTGKCTSTSCFFPLSQWTSPPLSLFFFLLFFMRGWG